jgi:hypothetical protein
MVVIADNFHPLKIVRMTGRSRWNNFGSQTQLIANRCRWSVELNPRSASGEAEFCTVAGRPATSASCPLSIALVGVPEPEIEAVLHATANRNREAVVDTSDRTLPRLWRHRCFRNRWWRESIRCFHRRSVLRWGHERSADPILRGRRLDSCEAGRSRLRQIDAVALPGAYRRTHSARQKFRLEGSRTRSHATGSCRTS